ncbi:MAG TPA: aminotransferase class V-fold PLP-dependent enzyme [Vicinamibacteria bacterium]|nr:aminotransferase class V-fold PLP-dependent enzyme [Vicinamibacteria bacterium]
MKSLYSRFFAAAPGRLHFAAHSHHPWPDVTREAQIEAWDDAARLADLKWERVFGEVATEAQGHIARVLDLPAASQVAFAPNTHEFVMRLLSCFPPGQRLRVVTTDSEFLSFSRQIARLEEEKLVDLVRVPAEPFSSFSERFIEAARAADTDLAFFSQVFFNSGFVVRDLEAIVNAAPPRAMVVIDGYHGFFAIPTSLRKVADRAFFLAGGYKYAQSGEGACFLSVPRGYEGRPLNTGWFAGFGALEGGDFHRVPFSNDGFRFMGATFDPVGLYRFNAVARLFESRGLTIASVDDHVKALQRLFLDGLGAKRDAVLSVEDLIAPSDGLAGLGHFLTFRRKDAGGIAERLAARHVIVDHRGDRLRFGFGMYHDANDVAALLTHL